MLKAAIEETVLSYRQIDEVPTDSLVRAFGVWFQGEFAAPKI